MFFGVSLISLSNRTFFSFADIFSPLGGWAMMDATIFAAMDVGDFGDSVLEGELFAAGVFGLCGGK